MKLSAALERIDELDRDTTLYAPKPWTEDSDVVVLYEEDDGSVPGLPDGYAYMLEVDLVIDVLEAWSEHRNGLTPTASQKCQAVIHYAEQDAYLIPD